MNIPAVPCKAALAVYIHYTFLSWPSGLYTQAPYLRGIDAPSCLIMLSEEFSHIAHHFLGTFHTREMSSKVALWHLVSPYR
jgi:hypothetical protein